MRIWIATFLTALALALAACGSYSIARGHP
jgi:hypothetical protein